MNCLTDWNCGLLPNGLELIGSVPDAVSALRILSERSGIHRFCFLPVFDPEQESLSAFLLKRDRAIRTLSARLPTGFRLLAAARIVLPRDGVLPDDPKLKKLCIPATTCLPVTFCLWESPTEIENRLARLARHSGYAILLPSAERVLSVFPQAVSERIFRLPGMVFQFSYDSIGSESVRTVLSDLLFRKVPVLFGSGVSSKMQAGLFDLAFDLEIARAHFDRFAFESLFYDDRIV